MYLLCNAVQFLVFLLNISFFDVFYAFLSPESSELQTVSVGEKGAEYTVSQSVMFFSY